MGKKLRRHISFFCTYSCHYRKYTNNDNKICPLTSSTCFQQHFHDEFPELRCNSNLKKLEWSAVSLTSTKSVICQIFVNCSPFQLLNMPPFNIGPERLKLTYETLIINFSRYYFKIGTFCVLFLVFTCVSRFRIR